MEPLADSERRRMAGKMRRRDFWRPVFTQQPHMEMAVVRGTLRLLVPRCGGPGARQVVKAVPMDARRAADQEFGGAIEAPGLNLLGAKTRNADFRNPDREVSGRADLVDLG